MPDFWYELSKGLREGGDCVLIAVQYRDGSFDMVKNMMLDKLISDGGISLFRRESGWVVLDRDPVRRAGVIERYYMGVERRTMTN